MKSFAIFSFKDNVAWMPMSGNAFDFDTARMVFEFAIVDQKDDVDPKSLSNQLLMSPLFGQPLFRKLLNQMPTCMGTSTSYFQP